MISPMVMMVVIFITTILLLVKYQQQGEKVFALAMLACLLFNLVSLEQVLANAVNPGLITLILLVICSFAVERTSFLRRATNQLFNTSSQLSYIKTLVVTFFSSSLLNNTAVVANMLSAVAQQKQLNPGKILLPISYAAILGGTLTLVGTSTNLIVNSLVLEAGLPSLSFFSVTPLAIIVALPCFAYLLLRTKVLPEVKSADLEFHQYLLEAQVQRDSSLIGKTVGQNGLRNLGGLFLVEIVRDHHLITPVAPDEVLQAGDKLIFSGDISKVFTLNQFDGLTLFAEQDGLLRNNLTQVLIKPGASIINQSLKSCGFRARFDAAVVGLHREGVALSGKLGDIKLQAGDLLMLAVGNDFCHRNNLSKNFFIVSGHTPDNMLSGWRDSFTVLGLITTIAGSVVGLFSLTTGLIFYLASLLLSQSISVNEIKRRFPLEIWLVVVSALTLATGFAQSGLAQELTHQVSNLLSGQSPWITLVVIYLVTLILTELVTNNAAAALMFPIAYHIALGLSVDVMPFVMAVIFGASASFISPYSYQTNLMVFNAGQYKLKHFVQFGWPLSLIYSLAVLLGLPLIYTW